MKSLFVLFLITVIPFMTFSLDSGEIWKEFRNANPFPIRTLKISYDFTSPGGDISEDNIIIILSEPPASTAIEDIAALVPDDFSVQESKYTIGLDGWLTDIVIAGIIEADTEERFREQAEELIWKIWNSENNRRPIIGLTSPLREDFSVTLPPGYSTEELYQLFSGLQRKFILEHGVWITGDFVFWITRPNTEIIIPELESFTAASDCILGTVKYGDDLIIIGNTRNPETGIPPVRTETLLSLASPQCPDYLVQSFERDILFAVSAFPEYYLSPIVLSMILEDTDFGAYLILADILIKGWPENGYAQEYGTHEFLNSPPESFPFDDFQSYTGTSVVYNWYDKRIVSEFKAIGDYTITSFNHTMEIRFNPDNTDDFLRERAVLFQDYLDENPNIIPVVVSEYTKYFLIFKKYGLSVPAGESGKSASRFNRNLKYFEEILNADDVSFQIVNGIIERYFFPSLILSYGLEKILNLPQNNPPGVRTKTSGFCLTKHQSGIGGHNIDADYLTRSPKIIAVPSAGFTGSPKTEEMINRMDSLEQVREMMAPSDPLGNEDTSLPWKSGLGTFLFSGIKIKQGIITGKVS